MPSQVNLEDFNGLRVKVVLELLRNGPMTQTALVRELGTNAKVLKRHMDWLVRNGIVKTYGSVATLYEANAKHPLIKWVVDFTNKLAYEKP
jgi:predicted ArsR family transcriptional regulator